MNSSYNFLGAYERTSYLLTLFSLLQQCGVDLRGSILQVRKLMARQLVALSDLKSFFILLQAHNTTKPEGQAGNIQGGSRELRIWDMGSLPLPTSLPPANAACQNSNPEWPAHGGDMIFQEMSKIWTFRGIMP